jgi:hypothetical protein
MAEMKNRWPIGTKWIEWVIIVLAIWIYCLPFLQTGSNLPGPENEYFQTFDQILEASIKGYGQLPLWNPYYFTGIPYVAHPMSHAFNPLISLPVLVLGALNGFKLAVFFGFVVAGLGMWWLGDEIGLSPPLRIWIGLMYAFSGVPAAKFIQGQYLMVFGFGWIPFSLAAILAAVRSKKSKFICIAALGLALLFLCGNVYYAYYMLYVIAIFALTRIFKLESIPFRLTLQWENMKVLLVIGALTLGLIAVQLLPSLEYRNRYIKDVNTQLSDSRKIIDILQDYVSPEPFRLGAFSDALRPEEFYAYTGWWPLIGMLALPLAWKQHGGRNIILFLLLCLFTLVWIDIRDMPWRGAFQSLPVLYQFRYPSRMVVVGGMALISAGGLGLDGLWRWSQKLWQTSRRLICSLMLLGLGFFMLWSIGDLARTCRPLLYSIPSAEPRDQIAAWLKHYDPGLYYVAAPNGWDQAMIGNQLRYINGGYAISYLRDFENQISERKIDALPKYMIVPKDDPVPTEATLVKSFEYFRIYRLTASLPFAFSVSTYTLDASAGTSLTPEEVREESFLAKDTNSIDGYVSSDSMKALILLSTYTPNWQLSIDGRPTKIYSAYGYMAAEVNPGRHYYEFVYRPIWFYVGLTVSLLTLVVMLALMAADAQRTRLSGSL